MKFEGTKISDLKAGENISGIYLLRNAELKLSSNKKNYLDIVFTDKTGNIPAKWWDATEADYTALIPNKLYYVKARVDLWKDSLQLTLNRIQLAGDEEQKRIAEFVPAAPLSPEKMLEEIYLYVSKIKKTEIRSVVMTILDQKEEKLKYYPAAKSLHHAVRSGLLYHIVRMLRCGEALCSVYEGVNSDLIFAGIILHDLAKIGELTSNELGISEYSKQGQFLGHIIMGVEELDRAGKLVGASEETMLLLKHMIVSHHYEAEFGSPKKPLFLEAELLHHIDMIDARVYDYQNATKDIEPGQFSEPVWSLDRRCVYKVDLNE
ncbi:MAG TPA: HD domain-containing protein [Clostridiaceae bacterium]|jgi:3'-5' exoribonuclease|nr:HD domain-containing protein [Clostridiaceae bacterium]